MHSWCITKIALRNILIRLSGPTWASPPCSRVSCSAPLQFLRGSITGAIFVPVLAVLAAFLWLQTASTVHRNLVRRSLRFRALAIVDGVLGLATFLIAVALAWWHYGVWSFVLSTLAGSALAAVLLFYIYPRKPRWRFSSISFRALAPFSGWYVGQAIAWYLVFNIDNLMVGKFLGIPALGVYGLAYNYSLLPCMLIGISLGNVVFAEFPRLYSDPPASGPHFSIPANCWLVWYVRWQPSSRSSRQTYFPCYLVPSGPRRSRLSKFWPFMVRFAAFGWTRFARWESFGPFSGWACARSLWRLRRFMRRCRPVKPE